MRRMGLSFIVLINMGILLLSNGWQPGHEKTQPASKPQPAVDADVLDDYIEARMRDLKIPGLALAIVRGDQIEHLRGYGVVDDAGNPVTPQTPFLVASLSKSITALAVMQLVEAGKIDLDAPVQTYLPWFQTADSEASAQITVRHLLNHTSGFSELAGYLRNLDRNVAADALETSVRALSNARLNTAPGEQYEYSNTNYDILGLLIQTVAGMPYETYIEENVYTPLQLQNAYTSLEEARAGGLTSGYVSFFGLTRNYDRLMPYSRTVVPSAGLFASVEDMAHYLLVHLNEGRHPERAAVLSPAGIATLHTPGVVINENVKYAMGWVTFPFPQLATANGANEAVPMAISHGGAWANFRSLIVMVPDLQLGVVVLINKLDQRREEAYDLIVWNTVLLAAGLEPSMVPGSADFLVRYGQLVGVGLIALLAASFIWTVRSLSRRPPHFSRATAPAFALLLALDLAIAGYILFVEMPPTQTTLSLALAFNPEVGVLYLSILIFTLGWGTLRTIWLGINMSQQRQPLKRVS
ncbi:MAG: beta-lactamase family protein [Anaerolineae bacterium]|nr:beta-lactamase family protein [Anaerolineae bacterium]